MNIAGLVWRETARAAGLVVTSVNMVTFVAPNLAWGEARGGSIPRQWGCDRRATKPQAKFGATLRAAVLFGPGGVARSLQIHWRDMRVARALPGPKTPRRKRHRIYAHDHLGPQSYVHGLGDGATGIMNAFEEQFGAQGKYTVDFWHVSEYLAQAAPLLAPQANKDWLHEQQGKLLRNEADLVLQCLASKLEPAEEEIAPVRSAHDYMKERKEHLDYAGAKAADLPIGSGEIEAGHRHVIQERLKISGAWWLE